MSSYLKERQDLERERIWEKPPLTQENAPSKGEKGGHAHLWTGGWHGQGRVDHKFHTRRAMEGFRAGEKNNVRRYVW